MTSAAPNAGESVAAPCVLRWGDLERMVAAVVEQRQRLTERTDRRTRLSRQLSRALEVSWSVADSAERPVVGATHACLAMLCLR